MLQWTLAVVRVAKTSRHDEGVEVKVVRSLLSWFGIWLEDMQAEAHNH
jgi:hypothetical protein